MSHCVVWVDIPVHDLERAMKFYSAVLGSPVSKEGGLVSCSASCPTPTPE